MIEENINWYSEIYGLQYVILRYFNAAGYDVEKRIVGKEKRARNLIPLIIEVSKGIKPFISIFGNDYSTKDGTGVRDYVHVTDIAAAHLSSLEYLRKKNQNLTLNLGSETGFSVMEILKKTKEILNLDIPFQIEKRRDGDVAELVSNCSLAKHTLQWNKRYSSLETLIKSTWDIYD